MLKDQTRRWIKLGSKVTYVGAVTIFILQGDPAMDYQGMKLDEVWFLLRNL